MTLKSVLMTCCFCGLDPPLEEYIEMELRIDGSPAEQWFGAHRSCFAERLARGFVLELNRVTPVKE
jgi:hypothetical protein